MDATGKVAIITGASRGIGAGVAQEMLRRGMRVATCARGAAAIADGDHSWSQTVDVGDAAALFAFADRVVERFGRVDLFINNAGQLDPVGPLRDAPLDSIRRLIDVNVMGVIHGSQWFVRHVRGRGGPGVLINISSGAASSAYAGWSAYCASKAAVERFSECVALEEGQGDLRVHAVAPGIVDTDMQQHIRTCSVDQFPMVEKFREFKARDAFNSPHYVARQLLALAFDDDRRVRDVVIRLPAEKRSHRGDE